MEDERRKFLQQLLALGGGAVILPELVEAAALQSENATASKFKLERPITSRILRRETTKGSAVSSTYVELEMTGANNAKQIFTTVSSKAGETTTMHMTIAAHENASDPTPIEVSEMTMVIHAKELDPNHNEISGTMLMPDGKVSKIGPMIAFRPTNLPNTDNMTDDELIARFLTPKLEARKP